MKIAVASQNRREVTGHAGRCRRFWIFTSSDPELRPSELLELPKEQCFHDLAPAIPAPLEDVDVLIVGGMGNGLSARLARHGIRVVVTDEKDPERAVRLWLAGELPETAAGADCHCHH